MLANVSIFTNHYIVWYETIIIMQHYGWDDPDHGNQMYRQVCIPVTISLYPDKAIPLSTCLEDLKKLQAQG